MACNQLSRMTADNRIERSMDREAFKAVFKTLAAEALVYSVFVGSNDLSGLAGKQIFGIEECINNDPRKTPGFKTAEEMFIQQTA